MAGSTERTSSRRRAWDTAAVLLSVLLVTLGTVYLGSNYTGPIASVAFGLLLGGQALLARYRPLTAWVVLVAAMTLFARTAIADQATTAWPPTVMLSAFVVLFGVAVVHRRSVALAAWASFFAVAGLGWTGSAAGQPNLALLAALSGVALVAGDNVRARREARERLLAESQRSEELRARRALLEERTRIARELHDIVAHHMSVIAVQASTAAYRTPGLSPAAEAEFASIADSARASLTELRRLLAVLRSEDEAGSRSPQPGLDDIEELIGGTRRSGADVVLHQVEMPEQIPAAVGLTVYRILQEALSNVVRHAPGATARVELRGAADALVVDVANDVANVDATGGHAVPVGAGHGILGMRERAELLNGELRVDMADGGFRITAVIPLEAPAHDPAQLVDDGAAKR